MPNGVVSLLRARDWSTEKQSGMKRVTFVASVFSLNASLCGGFAPSHAHGSSPRFVSRTPFVPCAVQQIQLLPSTTACCQREYFARGRIHTHVRASSYGDEGEYFDDSAEDDTSNSSSVSLHDEKSAGRKGRLRRLGKRIAVVSGIGLSVFGNRYARLASASMLAIGIALKLSKGIKLRESGKDDEEQISPANRNSAIRWLNATLSNLDRIDYAIQREKQMEAERRKEERVARGKEWASAALQTNDELQRKADEARREEASARKWADGVIQEDMQRQRYSDIERSGH